MAPKRKRKPHRKKPLIFEEYKFEITVVVLLALGIFLIVEELEIKEFFYHWIKWIIITTSTFISDLANKIFNTIKEVKTSNLVGILLIAIAIGMIIFRFRQRIIQRHATLYECPKCGGELRRVHRRIWHRILGLILWAEVKHFSCKKCSFTGIRLGEGL